MPPVPLTRIILVEDDPDIRAVAQLALEALGGFTVALCSSGSELLTVAPVFMPELILLDVMMPEMDGPTTLKQLRTLTPFEHIPVIFLTAKVQSHEIKQYQAMGALDVIAKPFDPMAFPTTVMDIWTHAHG